MEVDWSKAPEGATHFDPVDQNWLRQFSEVALGWLEVKGWTTKGWQYPNDLSTMPRLIARPVWTGEGRPPVGTVCGLRFKGVNQGEVTVLFMSQEIGVFKNHTFGHEQCGDLVNYQFYQTQAPEQVQP